jgi:hypothetical protein
VTKLKGFSPLPTETWQAAPPKGWRPIGSSRLPTNAALQSATAALAAAGYRASHEAHHHRVIQSLAFAIGAPRELIQRFDAFRKKRSMSS